MPSSSSMTPIWIRPLRRPDARDARRDLLQLREADAGAFRTDRGAACLLSRLFPDGGAPLTQL